MPINYLVAYFLCQYFKLTDSIAYLKYIKQSGSELKLFPKYLGKCLDKNKSFKAYRVISSELIT